MEERETNDPVPITLEVEEAKRRCDALIYQLTKNDLSLSPSPKATLLRLVQSELTFLQRAPASSHTPPLSFNIGHLEAVLHVLQQPFITGVSRVCKSITLSPSCRLYVDIVCSLNGNPVWFIVSDRNPRYLLWETGSSAKDKGLREKVQQVVDAAYESPVTLRPSSVVVFFSKGLKKNVCQKLMSEFRGEFLDLNESFSFGEVELDEEWTNIVLGRSFSEACAVKLYVEKHGGMMEKNCLYSARLDGVNHCNLFDKLSGLKLHTSLCSLINVMKCWCCPSNDIQKLENGLKHPLGEAELNLVNFDTTSMVAIVSGISNGGIDQLLGRPESELRDRFKGNYEFVIGQVASEKKNPIHIELAGALLGKRGIICEQVSSEFQDLISMVGGPNEKLRAKYFLNFLKVVPDSPSMRLMSLPTTRKLALKNKVVFGTGDYWCAPTLTANMGFVRAVAQTGMSMYTIEHSPQALIGD